MSTKTIPARTIKTCDRCGVEMAGNNCRKDGKVTINENALDFQGMAVASANRSVDLCDTCLSQVTRAIDAAMSATPPAAE